MSRVINAPQPFDRHGPSVFLAGSISGGHASNWQGDMVKALSALPITILNPRRPDWDLSWSEDNSCAAFKQQVEWELDMQEAADMIAMYFDPSTQAPVTLLELGLFARSKKLVVACPEGFWKRGNIQVVCERFGITLLDRLDLLLDAVVTNFGGVEAVKVNRMVDEK